MEQKALKCMEINQTLLYKQLPAHMIVTNFIAGEDDCNYEIYIREFINESSYFLALSNGQRYEAPQSESNKEPDAISDRYKLDFKLMLATSRMEANSILSGSITKYGEGKEDEKTYNRKKEKQRIGVEFRNGFDADFLRSLVLLIHFRTSERSE